MSSRYCLKYVPFLSLLYDNIEPLTHTWYASDCCSVLPSHSEGLFWGLYFDGELHQISIFFIVTPNLVPVFIDIIIIVMIV